MAVSVVDFVNTVDSGGTASRNLTKPNSANLSDGDWSVIFASGNLAGPPTLDVLPPGFTQPDARVADGTDTYLDILIRKWTSASIAGLASETWTLTYSGTSKGQFPCVTMRGIDVAATHPFRAFTGTAEAGASPTSHIAGTPITAGDALLVTVVDRLTGGVVYTQTASDTELLNNVGPATNAISQGVWFNAAPGSGSLFRTYNLSVASAKAVMYAASVRAAAPVVQVAPPVELKRWNGSAWVVTNKWKRYTGSAFITGRPKPYL